MPLLENKKYVLCKIDQREYCVINGQFNRYLASINLTLPQYLEDYEGTKCRCKYCGSYAGVSAGFVPKDTCGSQECAKAARKAGFTDEVKQKMSRIAKEQFSDKEWAKKQQQKMHLGNQKIGDDGLTGHQRTQRKREETLLKKYGHKQFANWEKTKQTWAQKPDEEKDRYARETSERQKSFSKEKRKEITERIARNHLKKYGTVCPANRNNRGFSKIGTQLFWALDTGNSIFKPKTPNEKLVGRSCVDFCDGNKVIEFFGDYWHSNPAVYQTEYFNARKKMKAADIWQKDAERIQKIKDAGYQVKIVWERDFKRHPEKVIQECKEWLSST